MDTKYQIPTEGCSCTRGSEEGAEATGRGGCGPWRLPGPQAPGQAGGPERKGEGVCQAENKGFQNMHLLKRPPGSRATRRDAAGSARKMDAETARQKAHLMKAEAIHVNQRSPFVMNHN